MFNLFKYFRKKYIPIINERPLILLKCVKCKTEIPFNYSPSFDHYCTKCRSDYEKRKSSYSPEEIKSQRDLWESRKVEMDQRRPGWQKQEAELDETLRHIRLSDQNKAERVVALILKELSIRPIQDSLMDKIVGLVRDELKDYK